MSNVIEIANFRKKPDEPKRWICDIAVFETETETLGTILDANMEDEHMDHGERFRALADRLDDLSFILRQQAEQVSKSENGEAIGTAIVFESGNVRVRVNDDKLETKEQREWMRRRLDDAKDVDMLREGQT